MNISAAELRARLGHPGHFAPCGAPQGDNGPDRGDWAGLIAGDDLDLIPLGTLRPAAVLVPFVMGPAQGVLLTRRASGLSDHPGQVSFPGGRVEPTDRSPEAAALREAAEEVALDPARVEVLGRLSDYVTVSGYRVTPVTGLLPDGLALDELGLSAAPDEVAEVFQLPLAVLMDPAAPTRQRTEFRGRDREFWVWPHPRHYIWGATAAILVNLARRLRDG